MANKTKALYYVDSCVIISYLSKRPDRIKVLDQLFENVQSDSEKLLITSSLTYTEVAYLEQEKQNQNLSQSALEAIDEFWLDFSLIEQVEHNFSVGKIARQILRETMSMGVKPRLRSIDANHIATALWLCNNGINLVEFFTYDRKLDVFGPILGLHICEPFLLQPSLLN